MTDPGDPWAGILDPGERIVWQGRPEPGVQLEWDSPATPFFFTFFTGFSIFWMVMASQAGGIFWMFGLLFFGVGAYNLVGIHFWKAYLRRQTFYTLTDKRIFIAKNINNVKTLQDYPINAQTELSYRSGAFTDITFSHETQYQNGRNRRVPIKFERLKSGRDVFEKMRQVQQGELDDQGAR